MFESINARGILKLIYLNMYIFLVHIDLIMFPSLIIFEKLVCIHHLTFNKFPAPLSYSLCVGIVILENILPAASSNFESFLAINSQLNKPGFKMYKIILGLFYLPLQVTLKVFWLPPAN